MLPAPPIRRPLEPRLQTRKGTAMLYDVFGPAWSGISEMDRMLEDFNRLMSRSGRWRSDTYSAMNVWANDESVAVTAEVPGVDPASLDISLVGDTLSVSGTRGDEPAEEGEDVAWLRRERSAFEFTRTIQLPYAVDPEKIEARQKDGVLTIAMRRAESERPRKITVNPA
jgi:HSP20 family protein